jgi:hypothetical protein
MKTGSEKATIMRACLIGLLALIALASAGCGDALPVKQVAQTGAQTSPTAVTTTSTPPLPMNSVATLHLRSEDGYTAEVVLRRGDLQRANGQQNGSLTVGTACQVNSQTDAVEPFSVTLTNTTPSYSASPSIAILADAPNSAPTGLLAEVGYEDAPQCVTFTPEAAQAAGEGGFVAISPSSALEPHGSSTTTGFFVVPHYYSPAHPSGDMALVQSVILALEPQGGGNHFEVSSASGVMSSQAVSDAVPLVPGGNGGCLIHQPCPVPFNVPNVP